MSSRPDPSGLESARQQILALTREVELLAGARLPEEFFFPEYLKRVIIALGADAAIIWLLDPAQGLIPKHHLQRVQIGILENRQALGAYGNLLQETLQSGSVRVFGPGDPKASEFPTQHVVIFGSLERGGKPGGVLQIFQRSEAPPEARAGYLQFIEQMCGHVARYFRAQEQPVAGTAAAADLQELHRLTLEMQGRLDVPRVALVAANDGAQFVGCDRVSVIELLGKKPVVRAISGQDSVNSRANLVQLLSKLAGQVLATGEKLHYTGKAEGLAPQIEEPLAEYLHVSRSRMLTVIPLRPKPAEGDDEAGKKPGSKGNAATKPIGALVAEQVTDANLRPDFETRLDLLCEQTTRALTNARELEHVLFLPMWRFLGKRASWFKGRNLAKVLAGLAALALVTVALILIPWEYRVEGTGRAMPAVRRGVFAPWDGEVRSIEVASGDHVEKGQLLLKLRNEELHSRVLATQTEMSEKRKQLLALQSELAEGRALSKEELVRLQGKISQMRIEADGANKRYETLRQLEDSLAVHAPIPGIVATFQIAELLSNRPVRRGELLLEVMDESGPWRLELEIPEHRVGHIFEGQQLRGTTQLPVDFILATATEQTRHATLESSASRSVGSDEGETVIEMFASVEESELPHRRIGAEVIAKIYCGKRTLGYVLFGDVVEFVRRYLWL